ncbi:sugar phosphate nucleotidyltransferase [Desulfosporosinus sp. Sb-LF]|uniref:sugar phosphate nucleotidyltransferase n=1 Tax=Desulfosporosinus sp. Sb-LF TaxID=2560027 RepID=UPI00107FC840|nr:sugar phosphate nucleotidyltransferase [Desulfosporosinus sp. Sb-LF]TGE31495.1 cupin domain-containing protein [Desulfosporosinus sp. Sb-LF]
MRLVLLSGGAGKRLWPISNQARAKQFIKILKNPAGQPESMAQRVWRQLKATGLAELAMISCCEAQIDNISSQLSPEVRCVSEPEQRDTFPAIALTCAYLHSREKLDDDEVIIVAPIDSYVDEAFYDCYQDLASFLSRRLGKVGLIGISPTTQSSSFGYMVPFAQSNVLGALRIDRFVEKPQPADAEAIIEQGALWNSGVFAFKLGFMLNWLRGHGFPIQYEELRRSYNSLPKTSFDYEVLEKASSIVAVKYEGSWLDLGTWNTLATKLEPISGKGLMSPDSLNTHIINELDIPILTLGASNLVIAASPDGILVADKEASPHLKEYTTDWHIRPMFEERHWGWYHVLDYAQSLDGYEILTKKLHLLPEKNLSYQAHDMRTEVWTITSGNGLFACNGTIYPVKSGDVLHIPGGTKHGLKAVSDLELIEVQSGINLVEEDITRLCLTWEETTNRCIFDLAE